MTALLEVDAIRKTYDGLVAVRDVSFAVRQGEVVGLMGANGAGKTTLFNLVSGTVGLTSGHIRFDGERINGLRPDQICRRGIGRTFQIVKPFPGLSVFENVTVGLLYGSNSNRPRPGTTNEEADSLLTELGLAQDRDRPASQLTLAGRKRLEIARALATRPRLLMLDEVMAGLTPTEVGEALDMLHRLHRQRGITMLIVEHNLRAMMQVCERIVVLHHGEKIGEGSPEEVIRDQSVIDAYLGAAK
jgi:branched-chain amino acid transport system ATP-binding protein